MSISSAGCAVPTAETIRFAEFELDLSRHELRCEDRPIQLEKLPFSLLVLLAEAQGRLVTREEIAEKLWGRDAFHDTENGINTAIRKIRIALKDDPQQPRVILTVPGMGYRLVAPTASSPMQAAAANQVEILAAAKSVAEAQRSWTFVPGSALRWIGIALAVSIALVGVGWLLLLPPAKSPVIARPVIAVLPLRNLASQPDSDYFSDGLTDEIIHNLSLIEGLEVKSPTSSYEFKNKPRNIQNIGKQLGANLILEGSVLRAEGKLRIDVALVDVAGDSVLWSQRYDREVKGVFAIQDEISRSIVNQLRLKLGAGRRRYYTSPEIYDSYLRGRSLAKGITPGPHAVQLREALGLFEDVIAKDPEFAPAYAAMAQVLMKLSFDRRANFEGASEKARAAAEQALQLDPLLPEAHGIMGVSHARDLAWDRAERSFRRALELDPNLSETRSDFARSVLLPLGKTDEAVTQARRAVELDPLSRDQSGALALVLYVAGRYDEAIQACQRILAIDPDATYARQLHGRSLTQQGRLAEAIALFERLPENTARRHLGYAYAKSGRRADAERLAAEGDGPATFRHQAHIYAGLGDPDRTLQALSKMAAERDPAANIYTVFPEFAFLRGDPRFQEFRRKQNLPANP